MRIFRKCFKGQTKVTADVLHKIQRVIHISKPLYMKKQLGNQCINCR